MAAWRLYILKARFADWKTFGNFEDARSPLLLKSKPLQSESELKEARLRVIKEMAGRHTVGLASVRKRPLKAIFFDMDSTVIKQESIIEMARRVGKMPEVARLTDEAMAGALDFRSSLLKRLQIIRGADLSILHDVAASVTINPGMETISRRAKDFKIQLFLISGGFDAIAKRVADELKFDGWHAHSLEVEQGKLTGHVVGPIIDGKAKQAYVQKFVDAHKLGRDEIAVVGDGANDIAMMSLSETAIGFDPKEILNPHLTFANYSGDHTVQEDILSVDAY